MDTDGRMEPRMNADAKVGIRRGVSIKYLIYRGASLLR